MESNKIVCELCKQNFVSRYALTYHLVKTHKYNKQKLSEYYDKYYLQENNICVCGKKKKFNTLSKGYNKTCGDKRCHYKISITNGQNTKEERYGTKNYVNVEKAKISRELNHPEGDWNNRKQAKETCMSTYGYDNPMKVPEIQQQARQTDLNIYGVNHHASASCVIKKRNKNNKNKYGVENTFQVESVKEEIRKTNLKNLGVDNPMKSPIIFKKANNTFKNNTGRNLGQFTSEEREKGNIKKRTGSYNELLTNKKYTEKVIPLFSLKEYRGKGRDHDWQCIKCNNIFEDNLTNDKIPRCPVCYPKQYNVSRGEKEVFEFLSTYISCEENVKFYYTKQKSYEIDIFIPSLNIGIEYDGLYYHSEFQGGKSYYYHKDKTDYFEKMGISLFHITDIEWNNKQEIIKSILLSKINKNINIIYARNCIIKEVSYNDSKLFLNENHLQKNITCSIRYGLYYQNNLVSLITFGKSRFNKNYDYELLRFCNLLNTTIIGGFSKLLAHFRKHHKGTILSYADRRFSNGELYYKNKFKLLNITKPNYWYFSIKKSDSLLNRVLFQKHKLKNLLSIFDSEITEWENMKNNNYDRYWDCGNMIFVLE